MNTPQRPENQTGAAFSTRRILPDSPQQVFDAFAQAEVLARWWGPNGFTNTFELFEFKPGGRWKFVPTSRTWTGFRRCLNRMYDA